MQRLSRPLSADCVQVGGQGARGAGWCGVGVAGVSDSGEELRWLPVLEEALEGARERILLRACSVSALSRCI